MTSAEQFISKLAQRSISSVVELRERALKLEEDHRDQVQKVDLGFRDSARNLLHYLAVRQLDVRQLQEDLASLGLSSLGRMEAHTLNTLNAVIFALHRIEGLSWTPESKPPVNFETGRMLLGKYSQALLGVPAGKRSVRIMVTMPTEAATNPELVRDLLASGMDVVRINCAHDGPEIWEAIIDNLRRAQHDLGRECKILMDLAGPKLRTGSIKPEGRILRIKCLKDVRGHVMTPVKVWLTPKESPVPCPHDVAAAFPMSHDFLQKSVPGDQLEFFDTRGKRRTINIIATAGESRLAELAQTAYIEDGLTVWLYRDDIQIDEASFGPLPETTTPIELRIGDHFLLTRSDDPGESALHDLRGEVINPAHTSCTLKEIFDTVKSGERIWFDDGKIGGKVLDNDGEVVTIQITQANANGSYLRAEKGINLPDTELNLSALTPKDLQDLEFVVRHADLVGLSFVRTPEDIFLLHEHLARLGGKKIGVILKIENQKAFFNLPHLLLASLSAPPVGVMVARGDLGVEIGFERLAEVQEEILWLCEAAHVPVIWATQVLEGLATKGAPSRAEVSDAVMSGRAECVMLNKGPFIVETVRFLNGVLERMGAHQSKRRPMMRRLSVSELD